MDSPSPVETIAATPENRARGDARPREVWLLWGLVRVYVLIGFRNRVAVLLDWLWAYVTFQRGSRLITGPMTG